MSFSFHAFKLSGFSQSKSLVPKIFLLFFSISLIFISDITYQNYHSVGFFYLQHVLERGKPHERSHIISKLTGKIVQMSQHKYASNVVEKCLEYGDSTERELLVEEIIGQSDENDTLLVSQIKSIICNSLVLLFVKKFVLLSFLFKLLAT